MSGLEKYKEYKTVLAVVAFICCHGKYLLLRRSAKKKVDANVYNGVGGKVEPGESFLAAVCREVKEETGLEIPPEKFKPGGLVQVSDPNNDVEWVIMEFLADVNKEVKIPSSEDGDFHWIDPSQFRKLPVLPDVKNFLQTVAKTPNAFIMTSCKYNKEGKLDILEAVAL